MKYSPVRLKASRWEIFIDSPTSRRVWLGVNMISLLSLSLYSRHPIRKLSISRYEILVPVTRVHPPMKYYLSFASIMAGSSPPLSIGEETEDLTIFKILQILLFHRFFIFVLPFIVLQGGFSNLVGGGGRLCRLAHVSKSPVFGGKN